VGVSFVPILLATAALLAGCEQQVPTAKPEVRPVRALTVLAWVAAKACFDGWSIAGVGG